MANEKPQSDNTEIEPLSDESLEEVAGGSCSWTICSKSSDEEQQSFTQ